jgi:hypothetical protein
MLAIIYLWFLMSPVFDTKIEKSTLFANIQFDFVANKTAMEEKILSGLIKRKYHFQTTRMYGCVDNRW